MSTDRFFLGSILRYVPVIGIVIFAGLFYFSSTQYPGGSQANANELGFDWMHNYWCNLLNKTAINGENSPSRPIAIVAMFILCFSLLLFFINFALNFARSILIKRLIIFVGFFSMLFAFLICGSQHDLMTILSSIFGLLALIGIVMELFKSNLKNYKITAILCIILLLLNNYIYYTEHFLFILPLLQKLTFAVVLIWIAFLNIKISSKGNS